MRGSRAAASVTTFILYSLVPTIVILALVAILAGHAPKPLERDAYQIGNAELSDCIDHVIKVSGLARPEFRAYAEIWNLCENQVYDQLLLNDFSIRRRKFQQNDLDERVNLWLVVAITLSGVVLAALQLVMSYRLAMKAKTALAGDNNLIIEQGKITLKSSITGLLIMALSLVFFIIYVKWIYQNYDVVTQKPANLHDVMNSGKQISGGALGWLPNGAPPGNEPVAKPEAVKPDVAKPNVPGPVAPPTALPPRP